VIRVYDAAGNVIETHEHKGERDAEEDCCNFNDQRNEGNLACRAYLDSESGGGDSDNGTGLRP
jgi:hypothetical protein